MSDDKPKPVDDLKEGIGLLFRAAKGAVEKLPTGKIEHVAKDIEGVAKDAAKEVGRAFESIGNKIDKAFGRSGPGANAPNEPPNAAPPNSPNASGPPADAANAAPPPEASGAAPVPPGEEAKKWPEPHYDDGYAPEPPKGPRIG